MAIELETAIKASYFVSLIFFPVITAMLIVLLVYANRLENLIGNTSEEGKRDKEFKAICVKDLRTYREKGCTEWFTIGKIYSMVEGKIEDNQGYKWFAYKESKKEFNAAGYKFYRVD